jgi:hypothetical protein
MNLPPSTKMIAELQQSHPPLLQSFFVAGASPSVVRDLLFTRNEIVREES